MKYGGIVRNLDNMGRLVLPVELRYKLKINKGDYLEIFVEEDKIALKKYKECCEFCDSEQDLTIYNNKMICASCKNKISNI